MRITLGNKIKIKRRMQMLRLAEVFDYQFWGEDFLLAMRYSYYVLNSPLIADGAYDEMERKFREFDPDNSSQICRPGSDRKEDYAPHIRALALYLHFAAHYHANPEKAIQIWRDREP